ncbi:MAG TPA: hypothetical protein VN376_05575, partial [Longilinea sp.]|nr:hypothetical protein [Longilinea sp.]
SVMDNRTLYIGIDLASDHRRFHFSAVEDDLSLNAISSGHSEDVLAFLAGQSSAVVVFNAPTPPCPDTIQLNLIEIDEAASRSGSTAWMQQGYSFYKHMDELGFHNDESSRRYRSVDGETAWKDLCLGNLFPAQTLESRLQRQLILVDLGLPLTDPMQFFEEITRHKLLHGNLPVDTIHSAAELSALLCAYLAWASDHRPDGIEISVSAGALVRAARQTQE